MKKRLMFFLVLIITMLFLFPNGNNIFAQTSNPKISVIVPIYNVEPYLKECLDSLINQTLENIEIICIDDSSTDNSLKILKEYAKKDNRIKVYTQQNQGAYVARNYGLSVATGEYVGFIDPDDTMEPNTFGFSYNKAKENNADIVVFGAQTFPEDVKWANEELNTPNKTYISDSFNALIRAKGARLHIWNKIYKKSMLDENNVKFREDRNGMDTVFNFRVFPLAKTINFIDNKFYHWRQHRSGSASSENWENVMLRYQLFINTLKYTCEDWCKYGYINGNEPLFLEYVNKKFGFYPKIYLKENPNYKNQLCKQIVDTLGDDILNDKNIKMLPENVQKNLYAIKKCALTA